VPTLFRVFPYVSTVDDHEPGGALYLPRQGGGRIDNPSDYSALYASDAAAGAIAEAFGRFPEWRSSILVGSPALPGSERALARYRLAEKERICNLDDPKQLLSLGLRPSDVVSREYERTRAWAKRIYKQHHWAGICWWSYYNPAWFSFGLWEIKGLVLEDVKALRLDDPALLEASRAIVRRVIVPRL